MTQKDIVWKAFEHSHTEKTSDWFWALGIIAVVSAIVAILFKNVLFALLILIGSFTLAILSSRPPKELTFSLTPRGLMIDNALYPYQMLIAFWISDIDSDNPILIIDVNKIMTPHIIVSLKDADVDDVHTYLMKYLPEEEMSEPIEQIIFERLGF